MSWLINDKIKFILSGLLSFILITPVSAIVLQNYVNRDFVYNKVLTIQDEYTDSDKYAQIKLTEINTGGFYEVHSYVMPDLSKGWQILYYDNNYNFLGSEGVGGETNDRTINIKYVPEDNQNTTSTL